MNTKRIIVEGPDGSGKSTLISAIFEKYGPLLHLREGFKHSDYASYWSWLSDELFPIPIPESTPVHNRLLYSELVYGPILRNHIDLPQNKIREYLSMLRRDAFLIYCTLDYADLVKSATENPQMDGVMENLRAIYHGYDDLMAVEMVKYWPEGRCTSYNFKRDTMDKVMEMLGDYLEHQ